MEFPQKTNPLVLTNTPRRHSLKVALCHSLPADHQRARRAEGSTKKAEKDGFLLRFVQMLRGEMLFKAKPARTEPRRSIGPSI
jgi:hypothetical protein